MSHILVLHGPNLNLLGLREPTIYGVSTLDDINAKLNSLATKENVKLSTFQSNWEGALIDRIHAAMQESVQYIIINPAALTHTSVGLRDALLGTHIPFIEVHLSNVYARESFRHHSFLSDKAIGIISGLGASGYEYALQHALTSLKETKH